jgi:hypothetical protein
MSAFGLLPFGTDAPWGGPGLISLITILPVGTNKLIAFFTAPPRAGDPLGYQHATNTLLWSLSPIDPIEIGINGEVIVEPGKRRPSFGVRIADIVVDEEDATQLVIKTVPQLEPGITYTVTLEGDIRGAACEEFGGRRSFDVLARNKPEPRKDPTSAPVDTFRDWANPFYLLDPVTGQPVEGPGIWQIDEAGDIVLDDNAASLKKRVLRVILTEQGAFAHLPRFGLRGLSNSVARQQDVQRIASLLQEQIRQFSDVRQATVEARIEVSAATGGGILRFLITVQPRSEGLVRLAFQQPLS